MSKFTKLTSSWIEWTGRARMPGVSVTEDCADCAISFLADDQSFHLRQEDGWWIVDRVDDRGQRHNDTAKFSTFDLVEKYLIWRWASTTRNALGVDSLGPYFYSQGYSKNIRLAPTENEWRVELKSPVGNAILSEPDSTIFSHLMEKSVDQIDQMVREGVT
jgi:Immunity protein 61